MAPLRFQARTKPASLSILVLEDRRCKGMAQHGSDKPMRYPDMYTELDGAGGKMNSGVEMGETLCGMRPKKIY